MSDTDKFKAEVLRLGNGRPYVMIHRLRDALPEWNREKFDRTLRALAYQDVIELTGADPSRLTFAEIEKSYVDPNGRDLYSVSCRESNKFILGE